MPADASVRRRWIEAAIVIGVILVALALIVPAIQQAREAARRTQSKNNLKQIGLALHNYIDSFRCLPPGGVFNESGTPFTGWPVQIMPYMDASPQYNQINFNFPWDDARNQAVFRQSYSQSYQNPGVEPTTDSEGYFLFHYTGNERLLFPNSSVTLTDITDGTEQTILAGEILGDFIPYAQPGNWRNPRVGIHLSPQSFGRPNADGALILMADGAVHWISKAINLGVFAALGTPAGNENIPPAVYADPTKQ